MSCTLVAVLIILFSLGCQKAAQDEAVLPEADWTITGAWKTRENCVFMGTNIYISAIFSYNDDGTYTQKSDVYTDTKCTKYSYKKDISGTFSTSQSSKSGDTISGYINIDSTLATYEITPGSVQASAQLNNANFCGFNNWSNGVKRSVVGRTCSSVVIPSIGAIEFSIFQKYFQDYSVIYPPDMLLKPPDEYYYRGDLMLGTWSNDKDGKSKNGRHDTIQGNLAFLRQ